MPECLAQTTTENFTVMHGDCCELIKGIPDESVGFSVFSPPFSSLYTYSDSERDMGNCKDDKEFMVHFSYLIGELLRVTKPGRNCSVHCMNLPTTKQHHGKIGIRDFRGDIIRAFEKAGWIYHSEVCIWKDPVIAMQRTKALGLLHKQVVKDSCMSRQGLPDYVCTFRKPGDNPEPVAGEFTYFAGDQECFQKKGQSLDDAKRDYKKFLGLSPQKQTEWIDRGGIHHDPDLSDHAKKIATRLSIDIWQKYASPVWMDINPSNTLQYRLARDNDDERHVCPLQLDVIERCLQLWSNPGDVVLSPFAGIGSELYKSIRLKRKAVGFELKDSYYPICVRHCHQAVEESRQTSLFD